MQDELTASEKQKYEKMWSRESYRVVSPGETRAEPFLKHFEGRLLPNDTITDFGCGSGLAAIPFLEAGLKVTLVDIAENCLAESIQALSLFSKEILTFTLGVLWDLSPSLPPTDWIYCIDVLEHIPTEKVDATLRELALRTKKGGALQVCLQKDNMGQSIGEVLHLTVKPLDWWLEKISHYWTVDAIIPIIPDIHVCFFIAAPKTL